MSRVRPAGAHSRPLLKGPYTPRRPRWCPWMLGVRGALKLVMLAIVGQLAVAGAWTQLLALAVVLAFGGLGLAGYRALGVIDEPGQLPAPEPGEWCR